MLQFMKNAAAFAAIWSVISIASAASSANWPQFRGPDGNGVAPDQKIPTEFGPSRHVLWKTPLPSGHSSPCIWQDHIFVTGHEGTTLKMICLRRSDGRILWERERAIARLAPYEHIAGSPANPTPATDGRRVCFLFDDYGVVVTDLDGKLLWEKKFLPTKNEYSYGASPVLDEGQLYLNRDGGLDSSVVCLDAATGEQRWRVARTSTIVSFCTPYVWSESKVRQILVGGSGRLESYDANTGEPIWRVTGLPFFVCPSPVGGSGMIYFGGWTTAHVSGRSRVESAFGEEVKLTEKELTDPKAFFERFDRNKDGRLEASEFPESRARDAFDFIDRNKNGFVEMEEWAPLYGDQPFGAGRNVLLAIAGGGHGDITTTHVKWETAKGLPYVSSPLLYRDRLYLVKAGGFISCLKAATGEAHYESERLGVSGEYYATPVAVGDHLIVCAHRGTVFVLRDGERLEIVARNELGETISATPAVVDNTLYLRAEKNLWAFRE